MPRVVLTPQLARHGLDPAPVQVAGATVAEALHAVFALRPRLQGYVLDDQARLRQHVAVFVDGGLCRDLDAEVRADTEIYVMQALSGG